MSLFNIISITKCSHGHNRIQHPNVKKSSKQRLLQDTFNYLLSNIQKPLGIHHIRTILLSLPVNYFQRSMRNHLSETLMLDDIQITSDYMSRWLVLKRRVGAVTSQRVLKVLFYVNILQCFFVVENFTANAVSVAIGHNGNRYTETSWNPSYSYNLIFITCKLPQRS
jgi:hypothetical protein